MNRPPLPATLSPKRTRRLGQNLTSLAPGLRGAVLFPVFPKIPQSESWISGEGHVCSAEVGKWSFLCNTLAASIRSALATRKRGSDEWRNPRQQAQDP